ncbi:hypothetical protein B484DRAFT_421870 [Ochromonadaceae sp. CCMP2298]|nr:hypothetical protein B484DRAFT_421870 [Ochromonadaceae sp. CCMP2298]
MTMKVEASLSSLSSDLLMSVSQYLLIEELGLFDKAINNKELRTKFLIGVSNDTYHFPGTYQEYDWRLIKLLQSLQHLKSKGVVWKKRLEFWLPFGSSDSATDSYSALAVPDGHACGHRGGSEDRELGGLGLRSLGLGQVSFPGDRRARQDQQ